MNNNVNNANANNAGNNNNVPNTPNNDNQPNNDNNTPVNSNGDNTKRGMTAKDRFIMLLWVLAAIIVMAMAYYFVKPFIRN